MAFSDAQVELRSIFRSLIEALELSDPYTRGHSERVASISVALGLELQLSTRELEILQDAGALHDIGKIGVSKEILNKPGPLTPEEFAEVKQHPTYGYNILRPLDLPEVLDITLRHHERLDGKGYPDGVTDYPLLVRVLQIADVWDALTSDRPYRKGMSVTEARKLMDPEANQFGFDTEILPKFLSMTEFIFPEVDEQEQQLAHDMRFALHVSQALKGQKLVGVAVGF
jgi:HD-GYP domain-containing protein (c-di-GMP phosphodiesterase class II)